MKPRRHPAPPGSHGTHIGKQCSRCPDPSIPSLITNLLLVKGEELSEELSKSPSSHPVPPKKRGEYPLEATVEEG